MMSDSEMDTAKPRKPREPKRAMATLTMTDEEFARRIDRAIAVREQRRPWYRNGWVPAFGIAVTLLGFLIGIGRLLEVIDEMRASLATVRDQMVQKQDLTDKLEAIKNQNADLKEQIGHLQMRVERMEQRMMDEQHPAH